jgi:hypothetical protein
MNWNFKKGDRVRIVKDLQPTTGPSIMQVGSARLSIPGNRCSTPNATVGEIGTVVWDQEFLGEVSKRPGYRVRLDNGGVCHPWQDEIEIVRCEGKRK